MLDYRRDTNPASSDCSADWATTTALGHTVWIIHIGVQRPSKTLNHKRGTHIRHHLLGRVKIWIHISSCCCVTKNHKSLMSLGWLKLGTADEKDKWDLKGCIRTRDFRMERIYISTELCYLTSCSRYVKNTIAKDPKITTRFWKLSTYKAKFRAGGKGYSNVFNSFLVHSYFSLRRTGVGALDGVIWVPM